MPCYRCMPSAPSSITTHTYLHPQISTAFSNEGFLALSLSLSLSHTHTHCMRASIHGRHQARASSPSAAALVCVSPNDQLPAGYFISSPCLSVHTHRRQKKAGAQSQTHAHAYVNTHTFHTLTHNTHTLTHTHTHTHTHTQR